MCCQKQFGVMKKMRCEEKGDVIAKNLEEFSKGYRSGCLSEVRLKCVSLSTHYCWNAHEWSK